MVAATIESASHADGGVALRLIGGITLGLAFAIALDFAFSYARRGLASWPRAAIYAIALGLPAIEWASPAGHTIRAVALPYVVGGIAAGMTLSLSAQAYFAKVEGALAVVAGATVLLATTLNDIGAASGLLATGPLVDAGLAVFIVSLATTPGARYAAVAHALEERTQELQTRTRELRRSYEDLRTIQEELLKRSSSRSSESSRPSSRMK
jgi:hypothetical protein